MMSPRTLVSLSTSGADSAVTVYCAAATGNIGELQVERQARLVSTAKASMDIV